MHDQDLRPIKIRFEGPVGAGKTWWRRIVQRFLEGQWCIVEVDRTDPTGHTLNVYPNASND